MLAKWVFQGASGLFDSARWKMFFFPRSESMCALCSLRLLEEMESEEEKTSKDEYGYEVRYTNI